MGRLFLQTRLPPLWFGKFIFVVGGQVGFQNGWMDYVPAQVGGRAFRLFWSWGYFGTFLQGFMGCPPPSLGAGRQGKAGV